MASSPITCTRTSCNNSIFSSPHLSLSLLPTSERQAACSPYGRQSWSSSHWESVRSFLIHFSARPSSVTGPTCKIKARKSAECLTNYPEISGALTRPEVLKGRVMSTFCSWERGTVLRKETSGLLNIRFVRTRVRSPVRIPSVHCSCSQDWIKASSQAAWDS